MKHYLITSAFCFVALLRLEAGFTSQTIRLQPGWNAVCLEVTPEDNSVESVFRPLMDNQVLKGVWRHHSETSSVRYIENPDELLPESDEWLTWFPSASQSVLRTLHYVHGGHCYFIKLDADAPTMEFEVVGRPVIKPLTWNTQQYSLTGLCVDPANPPTFSSFFSGSTAQPTTQILEIDSSGHWQAVDPDGLVERGRAYWIYSQDISQYQGPAYVEADARGVLDFASHIVERPFVLRNGEDSQIHFEVRRRSAADLDSIAGDVELSVFNDWDGVVDLDSDGIADLPGWVPLTSGGISIPVNGNDSRTLRLGIRRKDMTGNGVEFPFRSMLEVVTQAGTCHLIGVQASGFNDSSDPGFFAGLWVGSATVDAVQQVTESASSSPKPTSSEASMRVIVHVNEGGDAELIREVIVMWLEGTSDSDTGEIIEAGKFLTFLDGPAIATWKNENTSLAARLRGVSEKNGVSSGRRISSAAFSFTGSRPFLNRFGQGDSEVSIERSAADSDGLNPFRHRYHPDHQEGIAFTRTLGFQFDSAADTSPGNTLSGVYSESIDGLYRTPVAVSGRFILTRILGSTEFHK